jgi:hypothetical protein
VILLGGYNRGYGETNMGDAVLQIPFILHMARAAGEPVYFEMLNDSVKALVPKHENLFSLRCLPVDSVQRTLRLSINDVIFRFHRQTHPTIGLFDLHGVARPTEDWAIRPELQFEMQAVPEYDYLISPFSEDKNREWPLHNWQLVLEHLSAPVGVLGGAYEPKPWEGVDYIYGRPLDEVCSLIAKAKCLITIDAGPSRLAHALAHPKHVLLCSSVVTQVWGSYPGARVIYGHPHAWQWSQIVESAVT